MPIKRKRKPEGLPRNPEAGPIRGPLLPFPRRPGALFFHEIEAKSPAKPDPQELKKVLKVVEAALGSKLDGSETKLLLEEWGWFKQTEKVGRGAVRAEIAKFQKKIEALLSVLDELSPASRERFLINLERLQRFLQETKSQAESLLEDFRGTDGGPAPHEAFHNLITTLAYIYEKKTGMKVGRHGVFTQFAMACLEDLEVAIHSKNTVESSIRHYYLKLQTQDCTRPRQEPESLRKALQS